MTVETTISKAGPYAGAGTTGPFPINFRFLEDTHLRVVKTDPSGTNSTISLNTDYSVTGAGASSGGTATLTAVLPVGWKLTILRDVPATQEADYVENDPFPAESHERALDKLTMLVQQQGEAMGRALVVPPTDPVVSLELPSAAARARRYLSFDLDGRPVATTFDIDTIADLSQQAVIAAGNAKDSEISASSSANRAQELSDRVAMQVEGATPSVVRFSGTGAQTSFDLGVLPGAEENTQVYISGVYKQKDTYSVVDTNLVFASAPPLGTGNIEVVIAPHIAIASTTADAVSINDNGVIRSLDSYVKETRADVDELEINNVHRKNYIQLRAYTGAGTVVDITELGIAGRFYYTPGDATSIDDGGLTIVGSDGRRWVRGGSKLIAMVTPEMFGAVGDKVADDSDAIQAALNSKRSVVLSQKYRITRSMVVNGQRVEGRGVTINSGTWAMTLIHVDGNFSAFVPASDSPVAAEISGLFIWYADTTPTVATGNDQKVGFSFLNPSFPNPAVANPQFTKISNCLIKGGWRAYDASGGAYLFKLERVWSWSCRFGFRHVGGTTLKMDTCYALFGEQAYFIQGVANFTMTNCAMDQMVITTTTPQRAGTVFADIPGLNVSGLYTELNNVSVDAGSLVMFINCVGSITNVTRWREALSCASGQEVYGYRVSGGRLKMSGIAQQSAGSQGFQFTGTGTVMGLVAQNGALLSLEVSDFEAPTGGTPSTRYAIGAFGTNTVVTRDDLTNVAGGANNSVVSSAAKAVAFTPTLVNSTQSGPAPTVTGSYMQHGGLTYVNVQIAANGGTVAFVPNSTAVTGLPFAAKTGCAIQGVTTDAAGFVAAVRGAQIVLPYLAATSASISISGVYQTA